MRGRADDFGIGPGSKAADVGGHRIGEELDILRQVADYRRADSRGHVATSAPSSRTTPAVGWSTPTIWRASVDFPAPDGPIMPSASPALQPKRDIAQDRSASRPAPCSGGSTDRLALRPRQREASRRAAGVTSKQVASPEEGRAGRDQAAPLARRSVRPAAARAREGCSRQTSRRP